MTDVVVFVFYNVKDQTVLSEHRLADDKHFPNLKVFPSGKVEKGESIEDALFREAKEEFGITPILFTALPTLEGVDAILYPYYIQKWEGELPGKVLDKGSSLVWETINEAAASTVQTRPKIIASLQKLLL